MPRSRCAHPAGLPYLIFAALAVIAGFLIRFNWRLIEQPVRLSLLLAATVPEKLRLNRYRDAKVPRPADRLAVLITSSCDCRRYLPVPTRHRCCRREGGGDRLYEATLHASGAALLLRTTCGWALPLQVARWCGPPDAADDEMLRRCLGPVLDIGCGPGR